MWKRIISFVFYPLVFIIILLLVIGIHITTSNSGIIPLESTPTQYNLTTNPNFIVHLSDTHVSPCYETESRLQTTLSIISQKISPDAVILSGDITDNYVGCKLPTYSEPTLVHWQGYERAINASGIDRGLLFEVLGNHDMWGIASFSENEYAAKFTNTFSASSFYSFSKTYNGLRVVGFQPQDFPTGHGPHFFAPVYKSKMIEALKSQLEKSDNEKFTIVVSHFPQETVMNFNAKTESKETFKSLLKKHNVVAHLTGHTHPLQPEVKHNKQNYVEFTSTPLKIVPGFNILTVDHGYVNYEFQVLNNSKDYAILTSPGPTKSQKTVLNTKKIPIRVLSFSNSREKQFMVSGSAKGTLTFQRFIKENVALYSLDAEFENGKNNITISGDLDYYCEFYVGEQAGPFREKRALNVQMWWIILAAIFLYVYLVPILVSFWFKAGIKTYLSCILFGPIKIGNVVKKTCIWYRCLLTFFFIWPFFLPTMIYKTQGKISMIWTWGIVVDGKTNFDVFSLCVTMFYHASVFVVMLDVAMIIVRRNFKFYKIIIDILIDIVLLCGGYCVWFKFGRDMGYKAYWIDSFVFVLIPIGFVIATVFEFRYHRKRNAENKIMSETDTMSPLDQT
ncbi:Ser/Thr protein phosphatase, putative [Trichomonas vaginalis G3]|uniref:Ser/Thr protein phosphatase, putative n=1 Tax=Trichomonas vaginalis (strain ATCC PRA-98 / G3) TaxID=412133 RepID=A2FS36_TRIV3|nr:TMEM62, metallophosphatase domain-containing protein [Trichomonas vaginalis G3]EAX92278.1 Ser/Thr protein phosphatase, putative [Trichomonas vaginalis G3]KAI5530127.1 TMEM62, metallophosphatase domain-containing protein [Trichomonas vaginalis G3]|eukprot:XP_001305208.1 Ser/Thr protein phosphatase [Trichomonas vaginalis G3]